MSKPHYIPILASVTALIAAVALSALADDPATGRSILRFRQVGTPVSRTSDDPAANSPAYSEVDPTGRPPMPPMGFGDTAPRSAPNFDGNSSNEIAVPRRLAPGPAAKLAQPISLNLPDAPNQSSGQVPSKPVSVMKSTTVATMPVSSGMGCDCCNQSGPLGMGMKPGHHFFCHDPFGMCVRNTLGAQVAAGLAGQTILYRYDFCDGMPSPDGGFTDPAQLNPSGDKQLRKIAGLWGLLLEPRLILQPSGNRQLDAARREVVLARMSQIVGAQVPPEAVVIDDPDVRGTDGTEAVIQYGNLLRQTRAAAESAPQGSSDMGTYGGSNGFNMGSQGGSN